VKSGVEPVPCERCGAVPDYEATRREWAERDAAEAEKRAAEAAAEAERRAKMREYLQRYQERWPTR
jgi:hypothetical protein